MVVILRRYHHDHNNVVFKYIIYIHIYIIYIYISYYIILNLCYSSLLRRLKGQIRSRAICITGDSGDHRVKPASDSSWTCEENLEMLSSALQHSQQSFVPIIVQAQIEPSHLARVAGNGI